MLTQTLTGVRIAGAPGESWSAIGRQYGVSHTPVRIAVQTYRRYLADREYLAEHGPGEVPEKRA